MGRHKNVKFARKYDVPVEVLREGIPKALHQAPDHEVRGGNLVRVSSAAGLQAALAQGTAVSNPIMVYLVPYLPPRQADLISKMLGIDQKEEAEEQKYIRHMLGLKEGEDEEEEASGAGALAGHHRAVVIANPLLLSAKKLALMAIRGEEHSLQRMMDEMVAKPTIFPHEVTQLPRTEDDLGLRAAKHMKPLKESYLTARVDSGHKDVAINVLKQINKPLYRSLFKPHGGTPLTKEEKHDIIMDLANDYKGNLQLKSLSACNIARHLLGVISLADFEDKKKIIIKDNSMMGERKAIMKRLKKERKKFRKLEDKETLIGAAFPNFKAGIEGRKSEINSCMVGLMHLT